MGELRLLKLDDQFHPWENVLTNLLGHCGNARDKIKSKDTLFLYSDINAIISFYLNPNNRLTLNYDVDKVIFIISFLGEGVHHGMCNRFINDLIELGVRKENIRILYSTYHDIPTDIRTESFWEFFIKIPVTDHDKDNDYLSVIPKKHHLCLMRNIKPHRMEFMNKLRGQSWFNDAMDISFGVFDNGTTTPIVFDYTNVDNDIQHKSINPELMCQLFNIVVETNITIGNGFNGWGYITEKSMKPFYYCQVPIWVAQPGIVKIIRELGFDVFDDILDGHVYDDIDDDGLRMDLVVELMDRMIKDHNDLNGLKVSIRERLLKNRDRLMVLDGKYHRIFEDKFIRLLE